MIINGLGVSKGIANAKCVSLEHYESNEDVENIILVVEYLPPYISVLSDNVIGIIAEDGGMLSHAACIAREFDIPCVVGVSNAIKLFENKCVSVDGEKGTVTC